MSEELIDGAVYSRNVIEFVTVANEYCTFIENSSNFNRFELIDRTHKLFPLLYLKACLLPEIDDEEIEVPDKFVSEIDYNFLLNRLSAQFGQFDSYQEVFVDGMQYSEGAIDASIAENICDIYQDLKDFLLAYRIGNVEIMSGAIWECKNNFANYWGQKLTNGLRALHAIRYSDSELSEDDVKSIGMKDQAKDNNWVSKHFNSYFEGGEDTNNDI